MQVAHGYGPAMPGAGSDADADEDRIPAVETQSIDGQEIKPPEEPGDWLTPPS